MRAGRWAMFFKSLIALCLMTLTVSLLIAIFNYRLGLEIAMLSTCVGAASIWSYKKCVRTYWQFYWHDDEENELQILSEEDYEQFFNKQDWWRN